MPEPALKLTTDQMLALAQRSTPAALASTCTRSLSDREKFLWPKHIDRMSLEIAQAVVSGDGRVIITMPPRHGKSTITSIWTPVWFLEHFPAKHVILASYEADFAAMWGLKVRQAIESYGQVVRTKLHPRYTAADHWYTTVGGGMRTAGIGGPMTGYGADLLIIDDYCKNAEEAESELIRQRVWDWWTSTAYPRLEPRGTVVVVATRWHEDDLIGRLLQHTHDDEKWMLINFPAIAEEKDSLGRAVGKALWPERFDEKALARIQRQVGARVWTSLYQQRPAPDTGAKFKLEAIRYFVADGHAWKLRGLRGDKTVLKSDCSVFAMMDPAGTDKSASSDSAYTVIQVWAVTPEHDALLLDQYRQRVEAPDAVDAAIRMVRQWDCDWIGVEKDGLGLGVVQTIRRRGITVRAIKAKGSKEARSETAEIRMAAGTVYFPQTATWMPEFTNELAHFPHGKYKDQVDCFSHAMRYVHGIAGGLPDDEVAAERKAREKTAEDEELATSLAARRKQVDDDDDDWRHGWISCA